MEKKITTPLTIEKTRDLHCGDNVLISGVIYTGRDAAHKRLCELLAEGKELPIDVTDAIIYYVGPAPAQPGQVIGSAGPTTSYRMDAYAPALLDIGLKGMIGKGKRSAEVVESMKKNGAVYFGATVTLIWSPGTSSVYKTAGVLSPVLTRSNGSRTQDLRRKPSTYP